MEEKMSKKLIKKYQNPAGPLITEEDAANTSRYYHAIQEEFKNNYPAIYNDLQFRVAKEKSPTSEIITYTDANGNLRKTGQVIGLSAADPIAVDYVLGVGLAKPMSWLDKTVIKPSVKYLTEGISDIGQISSKKIKSALKPVLEKSKNIINKYTSPRTNVKHTPYIGDNLELTKQRLLEGGFDKLGIGPDDVITIPKDHPLASLGILKRHKIKEGNITKFSYGNNAEYVEINARDFLKNLQNTIDPTNGTAHYSGFEKLMYSPLNSRFADMNETFIHSVDAHEFWHAVDDVIANLNKPHRTTTSEMLAELLTKDGNGFNRKVPGFDFSKIPPRIQRYFSGHGNTELRARLTQLKNYFGISDPNQPLTVEQWNYARRHYVNDMGYDNNMQQLFRAVTNPQEFLDWINPKVASFTGMGLVGLQGINTQENE